MYNHKRPKKTVDVIAVIASLSSRDAEMKKCYT